VQHTSIDVYAYVEWRIILRINGGEAASAFRNDRCLKFILLHRTLYNFCARAVPRAG